MSESLIATASPEKKFAKAKALAARIGIHPKTLSRWSAAGYIHRHKINDRVVLYDEAEVVGFIEKAKVT